MRVLYLGANLRMHLSTHAAIELRGLGLKSGLEQAGVEVVPLMAGDQVNHVEARAVYHKGLKQVLPAFLTNALRDVYEIFYDWRLYHKIAPTVRDLHPDVILQKHARYGQVGIRLGRRYGLPVFLDDITPVWEGERYGNRSLKLIARATRKKVFSRASGLIAVSPEMERQLLSEGVSAERIHFVPNGVDCALFDPDGTAMQIRRRYGLEGKLVVGYVGAFAGWHKVDLLLEAAPAVLEAVPEAHFLMVGDGSSDEFKRATHALGLSEHFTFPGGVAHSEVPLYLNAMDMTVLPGTLQYMSPMKIYEYMAMGKPVVAPSGNLITEAVVTPNETGLLFESGNKDSLAKVIVLLLKEHELRQQMGGKARKLVQENFTWFHQVQNLIEAFNVSLGLSASSSI